LFLKSFLDDIYKPSSVDKQSEKIKNKDKDKESLSKDKANKQYSTSKSATVNHLEQAQRRMVTASFNPKPKLTKPVVDSKKIAQLVKESVSHVTEKLMDFQKKQDNFLSPGKQDNIKLNIVNVSPGKPHIVKYPSNEKNFKNIQNEISNNNNNNNNSPIKKKDRPKSNIKLEKNNHVSNSPCLKNEIKNNEIIYDNQIDYYPSSNQIQKKKSIFGSVPSSPKITSNKLLVINSPEKNKDKVVLINRDKSLFNKIDNENSNEVEDEDYKRVTLKILNREGKNII
jgi:hypothetical protein